MSDRHKQNSAGVAFEGRFVFCNTISRRVRRVVVWCGLVWCGVVVVWCGGGVVWFGLVWFGLVWFGLVWFGLVWCGVVWCGVVWCGVVWCGVVWCGVVWCVQASSVILPMVPSATASNMTQEGAEAVHTLYVCAILFAIDER